MLALLWTRLLMCVIAAAADLCYRIMQEYKVHNAEIVFREDAGLADPKTCSVAPGLLSLGSMTERVHCTFMCQHA